MNKDELIEDWKVYLKETKGFYKDMHDTKTPKLIKETIKFLENLK
jgi:hypothetical protein